jgi:3-oxoacyl-[acyl-carrier protein] reductase
MTQPGDAWIVVSGAAGALGGAIVRHFSDQGHRVLALDRQFGAQPFDRPEATTCAVDLLVDDDVRRGISETIAAGHSISLLVNAVGLIWNEPVLAVRGGKLVEHTVDSWRNVVDANLTAAFIVAKQIASLMARSGGGCIVNFSSIASNGNPGQVAYSAAKAGIEGLTRAMASELGALGIRVNAVALGFIDVPTTRNAVAEERLRQYSDKTPLGRLGSLADVIGAVEFLASNTFVNGAVIPVDGGLRV